MTATAPAQHAPSALIVGNSDGIGLALTRRLLAQGMNVMGASRRSAPIEDPRYHHLVVDVTAPDYGDQLAAFVARHASGEPLAVCIYAAGIGERFKPEDPSVEAQVFRVNLVGAVVTLQVVLPIFTHARRGHFIGLSSLGDEVRSGLAPSYAASKAGLSAYLVGAGLALAPLGVAVTNLRLGFVDTKMAKARQRPFMISVDRAVDVICAAMQTRPLQRSHPWRMAILVRLLSWWTAPRIWFGRLRG
jgi:NAD(P)-dependent dehydrogenase (short-subunit alcohol dehydrogenase family)